MITLIAAMTPQRVIGRDGSLPWDLPEDLQHFKQTTLDHPIIMGRKTYEGLPIQPLPKRTNIVVSRSSNEYRGAHTVASLEAAIELGNSLSDEVFVIGGQAIYELALPVADRIILSLISTNYEGNKYFPEISLQDWKLHGTIGTYSEFRILDYRR